MSGFASPCTPRVYGPTFRTRLDLMGLRFLMPEDNSGGGGGGYVPPATQADLDRIIQERVARAEKPFEALKGLDLADVVARYGRVKEADLDALFGATAELNTIKTSQGATEAQLTSKLTAAEQRAQTAEAASSQSTATVGELTGKVQRYEAAAKVGIPLAHAPRLIGSTPEELEADATTYKQSLRTAGYDPGQGQGGGGAQAGADGKSEADRRFGSDKQ